MYRQCTKEKAVTKQIQYEKCLLQLMKERSFEDITINDICDRMGTSRKSFYHFFKNKYGCIVALIDRMFYDFMSYQIPEDVDTRGYPPQISRFMLYQMQIREILALLIRNDLWGVMMARLVQLIEENAHDGALLPNTPREDALIFSFCGAMAVIYNWHTTGYKRSVYDLADSLTKLISPEMLENW